MLRILETETVSYLAYATARTENFLLGHLYQFALDVLLRRTPCFFLDETVSVWDKINDTKADIQKVESTVQEAKAGIYKDISDAARGVTSEVAGSRRRSVRYTRPCRRSVIS